MSRVQLALNVADLDASIEFYTKLFGVEPAKIRDGYANFAIADPPLKLILFTGMGEPGSLNHVGVEVESVEAVAAMIPRATDLGMDQEVQEDVSCCFAVQDKTWVKGPENDWEIYYVKGEAPAMACGTNEGLRRAAGSTALSPSWKPCPRYDRSAAKASRALRRLTTRVIKRRMIRGASVAGATKRTTPKAVTLWAGISRPNLNFKRSSTGSSSSVGTKSSRSI